MSIEEEVVGGTGNIFLKYSISEYKLADEIFMENLSNEL
jgi:hypothetical protein